MKRMPDFHDDADDEWLRKALRDDLAHGDDLRDDGFSARVVQRLPAPRLPWLDGFSVALVVGLLTVGLWPLLDAAAPAIVRALAGHFDQAARAAVALAGDQLGPLLGQVSLRTVLTVLTPALALAATAFVLAEV